MDSNEEAPASYFDINCRLSQSDTFQFSCGPNVPCFTECCGKLELLLTPYDLLRLRKRLGVSSSDFLDTYTNMRWKTAHGFPEVMMKMDPLTGNRCPFVTPKGCTVYEDRPGACRIYPLGRASTSSLSNGNHREFFFVVREDHCQGFAESSKWAVSEWLRDQGMEEYNTINDLLMELYVRKSRFKQILLGPQHIQMFLMACYNTDRFRDFLFNSTFLDKFQLESKLVDEIRNCDRKLLEFSFVWLKFALFGEPVITVQTNSKVSDGT
ncbi:MAG: YkgJ family cysteine cluster protein [Desulfomonile sp.]|jgi:Fe-S-cluster containining protein